MGQQGAQGAQHSWFWIWEGAQRVWSMGAISLYPVSSHWATAPPLGGLATGRSFQGAGLGEGSRAVSSPWVLSLRGWSATWRQIWCCLEDGHSHPVFLEIALTEAVETEPRGGESWAKSVLPVWQNSRSFHSKKLVISRWKLGEGQMQRRYGGDRHEFCFFQKNSFFTWEYMQGSPLTFKKYCGKIHVTWNLLF